MEQVNASHVLSSPTAINAPVLPHVPHVKMDSTSPLQANVLQEIVMHLLSTVRLVRALPLFAQFASMGFNLIIIMFVN